MEARKARARAWFEALRDRICAAFEAIEDALPADAPLGDLPRRWFNVDAFADVPQRQARSDGGSEAGHQTEGEDEVGSPPAWCGSA